MDVTGAELDHVADFDHLVVLAPRQDDASLMAGGLIAVARARGMRITVVVAADAEGSGETLVHRLVDIIGVGGARTLLVSTSAGDGHPVHEAAARAAASAAWRTDARLLEAPLSRAMASKSHRDGDVFFDGSPTEDNPFDELHTTQSDPWSVHSSFYEQRKRACTLAVLPQPRFDRAVELGCSVGALAVDLAGRAHHVLGIDSSAAALHRAQDTVSHLDNVELLLARIPENLESIDGDLIVVSEVGYFLSPGRMRTLADLIAASPNATVVACHWRHEIRGWPLDGPDVHEILRATLGSPRTSVDDLNFLLDVFQLG